MPLPLFPRDDQPVAIKQGRAGSCYLLVGLDCVLNQMPEGRALVKSRFEEYPDGSGAVRVKIKRNAHSPHVDPGKLGAKYTVDQSDPEYDYWYVPKAQVARIAQESELDLHLRPGVAGNCLAVKIIERISSYYYIQGGGVDPGASLVAHNADQRYIGSPSAFLANLLGVQSDTVLGEYVKQTPELLDRNINNLIKLKKINPNAPVYVQMLWGQQLAGLYHSSHALRVDRIEPDGRGSYNFYLVNPWDTSAAPTVFTLEEMKLRDPNFSHFSPSSKHADLTAVLLQANPEVGKYAYDHPDLFNTLLAIKDKFSELRDKPSDLKDKLSELKGKSSQPGTNNLDIPFLVVLHKQYQYLFPLIDTLLTDARQAAGLLSCLRECKGNTGAFLNLFIKQLASGTTPEMLLKIPFEISGPILNSLALEAKEKKDVSLTEYRYFSSSKFLNVIIQSAISQIASLLLGDTLKAKQIVEQELVNFYLSGDIKLLKNPYVKPFFSAGICKLSSLTEIIPQSIFMSKALTYFMIPGELSQKNVTDFIQTRTIRDVNEEFVSDFFSKERCANPRAFLGNLQKLSATNPDLAKHLAEIARQKMDEFVPGSYLLFEKTLTSAADSALKLWLTGAAQSHIAIAATGVINKIIAEIVRFPIVFEKENKNEAIVLSTKIMQLQLRQLVKSPEFVEAKRVLGLVTNPPEVEKALAEKMQIIDVQANGLQHKIQANKDIDRCFDKIVNFDLKFTTETPLKDIERRGIALHNLLKEGAYINAKKTLGLDKDPRAILDAFQAKMQLVDAAVMNVAQKRGPVDLRGAAEAVITGFRDDYGDGVLKSVDIEKLVAKIMAEKDLLEQHAPVGARLDRVDLKAGLEAFKVMQKFDQHVANIGKKVDEMDREDPDSPKYIALNEFHQALIKAKSYISISSKMIKDPAAAAAAFKKTCTDAIKEVQKNGPFNREVRGFIDWYQADPFKKDPGPAAKAMGDDIEPRGPVAS